MGDWDANSLRLDPDFVGKAKRRTPQIMGKFLRGPVPLVWLAAAGECGLKALRTGLAIWHVSGKNDWALTFPLTSTDTKRLGVDRRAKWLALRRLERAGLISTKQTGKNSVEVTILRPYGE